MMCFRGLRLRWMGLCAGWFLGLGSVQAQTQLETDEQTLKSSHLPTDTAGLVDFFRQRSLKEGDAKTLEELVQQLGSDVYRVREPAAKQLLLRGPVALPFLKAVLAGSPLEMKRRAELCIREIEATMQSEPIAAAARVLAQRKDPQAAEVLFNFLPSVSNDPFLEEEILAGVGRLTVQAGKVDPLLFKALKDPLPFRRAAAAYVLGRRGGREYRELLRPMLTDPDPQVVLRVRQGLVGKRLAEVLQDALAADEKQLKNEKIELTDAAVLEFFRKRTLSAKDQERLRALVKDLGASAYAARVNATKHLISEGTPALAFLKQVEFDSDVELSRRARFCLDEIRRSSTTATPIAAAHWLARTQPKTTAAGEAPEVLLAYLPFADDDAVEEEVLTSLTLLSMREPKLDAALQRALGDAVAVRRAAAAWVLGQVGSKEDVARVQALLDDPQPLVRLRAAQGMLAAHDKAALPVLVQLVHQVPVPYLNRVEEALQRLAEDKGPSETIVTASLESRQKAARAWEKWLEANQAKIDLFNLADRESYLGLVTICEYDNQQGNIGGQVFETNKSQHKRWSFGGIMGAMDAHTLANGRILVAENNGMRVSERDTKGEVKWEFRLPNFNPICCQRLPNGNTFIATYNMVMEVTPNKDEVYRHTPGPQFYIFSAHKARNGNIIAITAQGQIIEMSSKTGQAINTVQTNTLGNWCSVELQPNGHYLVASMSSNNIRELDRKGTVVWDKPFPGVFRATRLPNGNILAASMNTREVAEMDRSGTIRWRMTCNGRPWSVHYR